MKAPLWRQLLSHSSKIGPRKACSSFEVYSILVGRTATQLSESHPNHTGWLQLHPGLISLAPATVAEPTNNIIHPENNCPVGEPANLVLYSSQYQLPRKPIKMLKGGLGHCSPYTNCQTSNFAICTNGTFTQATNVCFRLC